MSIAVVGQLMNLLLTYWPWLVSDYQLGLGNNKRAGEELPPRQNLVLIRAV